MSNERKASGDALLFLVLLGYAVVAVLYANPQLRDATPIGLSIAVKLGTMVGTTSLIVGWARRGWSNGKRLRTVLIIFGGSVFAPAALFNPRGALSFALVVGIFYWIGKGLFLGTRAIVRRVRA